MSVETLRNRIASLQKEKVRLETSLSRELENARKKQNEIAQINRSITRNTSSSTLASKQRLIESKDRQLSNFVKKAAELETKVAAKNSEILKRLNELDRMEKQAQRHRDQDEKKRRDQQIRHTKEVTRELEQQSRLHSKLSSSPIVVKFQNLPEKITVLFLLLLILWFRTNFVWMKKSE